MAKRTLEEYVNENHLNARLYVWMQAVNKNRKTGGSRYAFFSKSRSWKGGVAEWNFADAFAILIRIVNGENIVLIDETRFRNEKNEIVNIRNPFYFTWGVILAYIMLDARFVMYPGMLKFQLAKKMEEVHKEAYQELARIINEEQYNQSEIGTELKLRDHRIDVLQQVLKSQDEAMEKHKARNAELESRMEELMAEKDMDEKDKMGFYFEKIARGHMEANMHKDLATRKETKKELLSMVASLHLHKTIDDELMDAINRFDDEVPTPNVINVHAGGVNIQHADKVEK